MNLIDYFNGFSTRSDEKHLTANARSLYIAILAEFNKAAFPAELYLSSAYLQHLSGIKSTCSFGVARTALMEAGFINHDKQKYSLREPEARRSFSSSKEAEAKPYRSFGEAEAKPYRSFGEVSTSNTPPNIININNNNKNNNNNKERDILKDSFARAREEEAEKISPQVEKKVEKNEQLSAKEFESYADELRKLVEKENPDVIDIMEIWEKIDGEPLNVHKNYGMHKLIKMYGTEVIRKAILNASQSNDYEKYPKMTYSFFKLILERKHKYQKYTRRN